MLNDLKSFWSEVEFVLLDMDGTLLDKHFDDYFWEKYVPAVFASKHDITISEASSELLSMYKSKEGTLDWTDLDFWSNELGLDIPDLKNQVDHLIAVHPYVVDFLNYCQESNKKTYLVTNAHSKTLEIKMGKTALQGFFDKIVCSQEVGLAKEDPAFWGKLQAIIPFVPEKTMLADDTEKVLLSAEEAGIKHLIYVAKPSSKEPPRPSKRFNSITYFKELII